MTRNISSWILAIGGIVASFGLLRVYSIYFADQATRDDLINQGQAPWSWAALGAGIILLAIGWWMRRGKQTA